MDSEQTLRVPAYGRIAPRLALSFMNPPRQPTRRKIAPLVRSPKGESSWENESPQMNAAIPERRPATEEISGVIERVTFHNDESGFCVLRVKARGQREETTVVGSLPSVTAGEWLSAEGWWVRDKDHGLQFKATTMKTVPPTTAEGIERYLGSGLVKGIGPILAKKLVGRFGADVLAVIENRAAELQSVDGIGPKRRERIAHAWQEARQVREIMLFLHSHGVSTSRAVRIFKTYGEQAIEKVRSNPYMLAKDIYGIGFATADQIAQKVGIPRDSLNRARAGIDHVLLESTSDGHCALPLEKLKLAAVKLLEVPEGTVEQALSQMLTSGSLLLEEIDGDPLIFLPHLRRAEEGIAARIKNLAEAEPIYPPIDFDKAVAWCEGRTGKTLAPSQREALKTVLANRVVVITGGPGVGKTTLVNSILMILRVKGVKCLLCAPTGRAAKRLSETTDLEAKTIHRLLEIDPATGRFSRERVEHARLRSSGGGRNLDGGRAADALACAGCPLPRRIGSGRRRRPTSVSGAGDGAA